MTPRTDKIDHDEEIPSLQIRYDKLVDLCRELEQELERKKEDQWTKEMMDSAYAD